MERLDLPSDEPILARRRGRIELKTLAGEAVRQLQQAGAEWNDVIAIEEEVADLLDDDEFWRYQARGLALWPVAPRCRRASVRDPALA